jgi:hypothetical protein
VANNCLVGGTCYAEGAFNPAADCEQCQSVTSTTTFTALAIGASCLDDGNLCTTDVCGKHGNQVLCDHNAAAAGTLCRAKQDECDVAETCPGGGSTVCPGDSIATAGTAWKDPSPHTVPFITVDNNVKAWRANTRRATSAPSVAAATECDLAETCNGSSTCPAIS